MDVLGWNDFLMDRIDSMVGWIVGDSLLLLFFGIVDMQTMFCRCREYELCGLCRFSWP